jgi:hypothetical protein
MKRLVIITVNSCSPGGGSFQEEEQEGWGDQWDFEQTGPPDDPHDMAGVSLDGDGEDDEESDEVNSHEDSDSDGKTTSTNPKLATQQHPDASHLESNDDNDSSKHIRQVKEAMMA